MISRLALTAAIIAATTSFAGAQDTPPPPPGAAAPMAPDGADAPPPPPGEMAPKGPKGPRDGMQKRGGPQGPHGMRGPRQDGASFHLIMGPGKTIVVECGEELIGACIAASKPLLDMARDAGPGMAPPAPGMMPPPPPPPAN